MTPTISKNKNFYCIGLSYLKADATMRGMFSLTPENKEALLTQARSEGFEELLVISTVIARNSMVMLTILFSLFSYCVSTLRAL